NSGQILYAHNPHQLIPPASLAKLVTLKLAYQAIGEGRLSADSLIPISGRAHFSNQPAGSSLMYIAEGHRVTLYELMLGLALPSGNDAAVAVAEAVAGSVEDFVTLMNDEARRLGLSDTTFTEPAGIAGSNITTAYDFARFTRSYLASHPYAIEQLHNRRSFTYPTAANLGNATVRWAPMLRGNTNNSLLNNYEYADGLKTGFIRAAGYNLVATARRDGMQLIAVILGVQAPGPQTGSVRRNQDAITLFDYGFNNFEFINLNNFIAIPARIWGGEERTAWLKIPNNKAALLIRRCFSREVTFNTPANLNLLAPLPAGYEAGRLTINYANNSYTLPLITAGEIPAVPNRLLYKLARLALWFKQLALTLKA
ncbi:MAG: D-alanyl-D-alanine carboxypeptidase, partial [Spirochaetaceae bacterium]|nr:D-alanyl-D-alanine carboxypeptidase [Spirochaetaceae bacterium]